jgi:hypothetical protein
LTKRMIILEIIVQRLAKKILRTAIKSADTAPALWQYTYQTVQVVKTLHVGWEAPAVLFRDFDLIG